MSGPARTKIIDPKAKPAVKKAFKTLEKNIEKMWVIKFEHEGAYIFPDYVFSTKKKAEKFLKEDEWSDWGEVVEIEVDP